MRKEKRSKSMRWYSISPQGFYCCVIVIIRNENKANKPHILKNGQVSQLSMSLKFWTLDVIILLDGQCLNSHCSGGSQTVGLIT